MQSTRGASSASDGSDAGMDIRSIGNAHSTLAEAGSSSYLKPTCDFQLYTAQESTLCFIR